MCAWDKERNQPRLRQRYLYRRECETCEGNGGEDEDEVTKTKSGRGATMDGRGNAASSWLYARRS